MSRGSRLSGRQRSPLQARWRALGAALAEKAWDRSHPAGAGDASASIFRSVIVLVPDLCEERQKRAAAQISARSLPSDKRGGRVVGDETPTRSVDGVRRHADRAVLTYANLQSIRLLNWSDAIDSDHSLDATEILRLSWSMTSDTDNSTLLQVLVLERVDRARNIARFYVLSIEFDALRGSSACAALGPHRERGTRADRLAPVPPGRPDRAQEMARSQEGPQIPAPGLRVGDRCPEAGSVFHEKRQ